MNHGSGHRGSQGGEAPSLKQAGRDAATARNIQLEDQLRRRDQAVQSFQGAVSGAVRSGASDTEASREAIVSGFSAQPATETKVWICELAIGPSRPSFQNLAGGERLEELQLHYPRSCGTEAGGRRFKSLDLDWGLWLQPTTIQLVGRSRHGYPELKKRVSSLLQVIDPSSREEPFAKVALRCIATRVAATGGFPPVGPESEDHGSFESDGRVLHYVVRRSPLVNAGADLFTVDVDVFVKQVPSEDLLPSLDALSDTCARLLQADRKTLVLFEDWVGAEPDEGDTWREDTTRLRAFPEFLPEPHVADREEDLSFEELNSERIDLLSKRIFGGGLSELEEARLAELTEQVDLLLPPVMDAESLDDLDRMVESIRQENARAEASWQQLKHSNQT
ncbi:MAG: hypothetical protein KDD47_16650 [Acidobacteria bacterium]|nr:hypothetical protein [Acidobacteriota bacterium]